MQTFKEWLDKGRHNQLKFALQVIDHLRSQYPDVNLSTTPPNVLQVLLDKENLGGDNQLVYQVLAILQGKITQADYKHGQTYWMRPERDIMKRLPPVEGDRL